MRTVNSETLLEASRPRAEFMMGECGVVLCHLLVVSSRQ